MQIYFAIGKIQSMQMYFAFGKMQPMQIYIAIWKNTIRANIFSDLEKYNLRKYIFQFGPDSYWQGSSGQSERTADLSVGNLLAAPAS